MPFLIRPQQSTLRDNDNAAEHHQHRMMLKPVGLKAIRN